jgi:voltage-gated potassium channel
MSAPNRSITSNHRAARLERLERGTEWPLTLLAIALIPILLAPLLFDLGSEMEDRLVAIDYLIWGIFAADLLAKLAVAPSRGRYLRQHWVDVLMVALPMLRPLRVLRVFKAGRIVVTLARVAGASVSC